MQDHAAEQVRLHWDAVHFQESERDRCTMIVRFNRSPTTRWGDHFQSALQETSTELVGAAWGGIKSTSEGIEVERVVPHFELQLRQYLDRLVSRANEGRFREWRAEREELYERAKEEEHRPDVAREMTERIRRAQRDQR